MTVKEWRGTSEELLKLRAAVERNCACASLAPGAQPSMCPAHQMLTSQLVLDHMLYVYRSKDSYLREEFTAEV